MKTTHILPPNPMGSLTRTRLLGAAFCLSLCGLGLTAGAQKLAQLGASGQPTASYCGNGAVEAPEQCDDGNRYPHDACNSSCRDNVCGDNRVNNGEQCDTKQITSVGNGTYEGCSTACSATYCGDGIVQLELRESCDDGNMDPNDGCSNTCRNACGDGIDNDGDGTIDGKDRGCTATAGANEAGPTDFSIVARTSPRIQVGSSVGWSAAIRNKGPDVVSTPVTVDFSFPEGFSPVLEGMDARCVANAGLVTCTVSPQDFKSNGQVFTLSLAAQAAATAACPATATLDARMASTPQGDPQTADNESRVTIAVTCPSMLGDLSNDGTIAANDATMALRIAESGATPTADELARGDVNKNGRITKVDALLILDRVSGNIASLPAVCGDLNNDAAVTTADGTIASRIANNTLSPAATLTQRTLADANRDGTVDQADVQIILDVVSGVRQECFADAVLLGDVNGNGQVQSNDATLVSLHAAGTQLLTAEQVTRADVNKNGKITNADAYLISAHIVGIITLPAKFGDVTGDMNVTSTDASRVSQMIQALALRDDGSFYASMLNLVAQLNATEITPQMRFLADVNRDGAITQADVTLIMQAAIGIHFELPVEATATATCTDTDGGNKPDVYGKVTTSNGQVGDDACTNEGGPNGVFEYFCDAQNAMQRVTATCQYGCMAGACKPKPVAAACVAPALVAGATLQNQANPMDVNNDGTFDAQDYLATMNFYRAAPSGAKAAARANGEGQPMKYMNINGLTENGVEMFDVQDLLLMLSYYRCHLTQAQPPAETVTLSSVVLAQVDGADVGKVTYEKNFDTCAHLKNAAGQLVHKANHFCQRSGTVTVKLSDGFSAQENETVKLCHGNKASVCSQAVTVTKEAPVAQTMNLASVTVSCVNNVNKVTFNYSTSGISTVGVRIYPETGTTAAYNGMLAPSLPYDAPRSATVQMNAAVGAKFRLCLDNATKCSAAIATTGTACGAQPVACAIPDTLRKGTPHQYQPNPYDVNNDGGVTNADAQAVINHLNTVGAGAVPSTTPPPFLDVDGDNSITALDSLLVINYLNSGCGGYPVTPTACNPPPTKNVAYQNKDNSLDVDNNALINERDATAITNHLNTIGAGVPPSGTVAPPFLDVNGDGSVTAIDSLQLINRLNAGCSTGTPSTAMLDVAVKNIGTTNTAVRNQRNVQLLRFEAKGNNQDPTITRVVAKAAAGNLLNAQNYTLWADNDGDGSVETIVQTGVAAQNNLVSFNDPANGGFMVSRTSPTAFEIRADIASSTVSNELQLALATETPGYVTAEIGNGMNLGGIRTNGTCPGTTCMISVTTTPSIKYLIGSQGSLFVTLDSTPVRQRQLLAGALSEPIMRVQLRAQDENIDVTMLRFVSVGGLASSVDRLELVRDGETTSFATATSAACSDFSVSTYNGTPSQTFCAPLTNRQLVVQNGQTAKVLVKARLRTDEQGGMGGDPIQLAIDTAGGGGGGGGMTGGGMGAQVMNYRTFGFVEARGAASSNALTPENIYIGTPSAGGAETPVVSPKHVSVLSKIVTIANANPDADGTNVPTGLSPIGQFKFTAAANQNTANGLNKVSFQRLRFQVTSTNVQFGDFFNLYNKADPSVKATCQVTGGGGAGGGDENPAPRPVMRVIVCDNLRMPGRDFMVDSGESDIFVLENNIAYAQLRPAYASNLQVIFEGFSTPFADTNSDQILWEDRDSGPTSKRYAWIEYPDTIIRSTNYGSPAGHGAATSSSSSVAALTDNAACNTTPWYGFRTNGDVIAGKQFLATIVIDNPGASTWTVGPNAPYTAVVTSDTPNWGGTTATYNPGQPAETPVKPTQMFSFGFWPLMAPATPGTYPIKVQMQKNGVGFGPVCTHSVVVKPATGTTTTTTTPLVGDNCPDVKTAKQQMALFGSAGKFRQTSDGKFLLWAALEGGSSRYVKGVNFDTCETETFGTAESVYTGIDEISVCADGSKILYKDRTVVGNANVSKLWLVDRATKTKTLVTDKAYSNGTGDRALISRDCNSIVMTAWGANIDNDPTTTISNADGSRELFRIKNVASGSPMIAQLTNFVGGTDQYTGMNDAQCVDTACRFISVNLDWNPVTGMRHERNILTTAPKPSDITLWQNRVYLVDTQAKTFHKISDASNVSNRESFQGLIDAKITEITGTSASTGGFFRSFFARIAGSVLDMADLAGSLLR